MPADSAAASRVVIRDRVAKADLNGVRDILESTKFFNPEEVEVARSLVVERLRVGVASGYSFLFADVDGMSLGYTCYGRVAGTRGSFDLYWIAVRPSAQGSGIGRRLLAETEARVRSHGGERVYIETSEKELYRGTRSFYRRAGYRKVALLKDFYAPGDAKVIYVKVLSQAS